jgi:spore germination protein GerM
MGVKRILIFVVLAVVIGGVISLVYLDLSGKPPALDQFDSKVRTTGTQASDKRVVHIYFADKENTFLKAEERVLSRPDDPVDFGRAIIETLIRGPQEGLMRTIPSGATLKALHVTEDGTAYVDMTKALREQHPGGSESELMTIYSIANSLILNIPEIKAVKILIEGQEAMTLAGHMDLRYPFKANMLLIR